MDKDGNVRYKGYKSPTLHLVLLSFATGTGLLLNGTIDQNIWNTGVLGSLTAYITATGISKAAEAYMASRTSTMTTTTTSMPAGQS